eukprot:scaffold187820_cov35-Prasinocladus_malaysianus.AAC.2
MFGPELSAAGGVHAEEKEMAARQRKLVFELNRTGKYLELKEKLRGLIVKVVKEKYRKSGDMGCAHKLFCLKQSFNESWPARDSLKL